VSVEINEGFIYANCMPGPGSDAVERVMGSWTLTATNASVEAQTLTALGDLVLSTETESYTQTFEADPTAFTIGGGETLSHTEYKGLPLTDWGIDPCVLSGAVAALTMTYTATDGAETLASFDLGELLIAW
jgi:hypothetical protein